MMPLFVLRAVRRQPDGTVDRLLHERTIEAKTARQAIARARRLDLDLALLGANAIQLVDARGSLLWLLRREDAPCAPTGR